jgi:hypothetical protein
MLNNAGESGQPWRTPLLISINIKCECKFQYCFLKQLTSASVGE